MSLDAEFAAAARDLVVALGESEPVVVHAAGGDVPLTAVYDQPWRDESLGNADLRRPDPVLTVHSADLVGVAVAAGTTVTVRGLLYTVLSVEPDAHGAYTRLPIRRYA